MPVVLSERECCPISELYFSYGSKLQPLLPLLLGVAAVMMRRGSDYDRAWWRLRWGVVAVEMGRGSDYDRVWWRL